MGNREETMELMKSEGFMKVLAWYQFVPWKIMTLEQTMKYTVPFMRARIKAEHWDKLDDIGRRLAEEFLKVNSELGLPVGCHALMVYAEKPSNGK